MNNEISISRSFYLASSGLASPDARKTAKSIVQWRRRRGWWSLGDGLYKCRWLGWMKALKDVGR